MNSHFYHCCRCRLGYAFGLILMPAFMAITYGFDSASEILLARYFGVELLRWE